MGSAHSTFSGFELARLCHEKVRCHKRQGQWVATLSFQKGPIGIDSMCQKREMAIPILRLAHKRDVWVADHFVAIALVNIVEASDIEHAGLIFEIEKHYSPTALSWRKAQADGISHDKNL